MRSGPKTLTEDWEYSIKSLLVSRSIVWRVMIPLFCSKYKKRWEWKCLKVWFFLPWPVGFKRNHETCKRFNISDSESNQNWDKKILHRNKLNYPHILFELVNLYVMLICDFPIVTLWNPSGQFVWITKKTFY